MSGIIGNVGSKSGVIGLNTIIGKTANFGDEGGTSVWLGGWSSEIVETASSYPTESFTQLSGFTIGSKLLINLTVMRYDGTLTSSNYFNVYLSTTSGAANAGLVDNTTLAGFMYQDPMPAGAYRSYSATYLTNPILITNPQYQLYTEKAGGGSATLVCRVKGVIIELKQ